MASYCSSVALLALAALLVALLAPAPAHGHGMLISPANRGSAWRYGFNVPADYNDNEQFCGGQNVMHSQNGGKCGLCGDNFQAAQPRAHEMGGKYGTGTITASYVSGSVIRVTATLTTNHKGGFTFELCPLSGPGQTETEECFARYPLQLATGGNYYALPNYERGDFSVDLLLPTGLRCSNCVLRWTYVAANTWGNCGDGTSAAGCGPQETFKNCADITIV